MVFNSSTKVMPTGIKQTRRVRIWTRPSVIFAAGILSFIMLPSFQALFGYTVFRWVAVLFIFWALSISLERGGIWLRMLYTRRVELFVYALWCCLAALYSILSPSGEELHGTMGSFIKAFFSLSLISMCYIIAIAYSCEGDREALIWLVKFLFVALGMNSLLSIPSLLSGDLVTRVYINSYQSIEGQRQSFSQYGIGGLGLYGAEAILSSFFLLIVLQSRGLRRVLYLVLFVGITANIFMSSLLAPTLIFTISVTLFILIFMAKRGVSLRVRMIIVALAMLVATVGVQLSEQYAMQYSMNKLAYLLDSTSPVPIEGNTIDMRKELYLRSIKTFLEFPLLGAGAESVSELSSRSEGIGGHSGIFDGFAMYGILFGIYIAFLAVKLRHLRVMVRRNRNEFWTLASLISFSSYFLVVIVDPLIFDSATSGAFFLFVIGSAIPGKYFLSSKPDLYRIRVEW